MPTSKISSAYPPHVLTSVDTILFKANSNGIIRINLGKAEIDLTFDAAQDFLFELAGFIAAVEKRQQKTLAQMEHPDSRPGFPRVLDS